MSNIKKTVGVLGGGQLGLMLTEAARNLKVNIVTLDQESCPVLKMIHSPPPKHIIGSFIDPSGIRELAAQCDILTFEIEHVNTDVVERMAIPDIRPSGFDASQYQSDLQAGLIPRHDPKEPQVEVQPSWRTIRIIQDKFLQKVHLKRNRIPVADSRLVDDNFAHTQAVAKELGYPFMLKARKGAYDGNGNFPVKSEIEIPAALKRLKGRPLYAEGWANFMVELAVMVVKVVDEATDSLDQWEKATLAYPVVETIHENSICKLVYAPARNIPWTVMQKAQKLARQAVSGFWGKGVFGVEMFLLEDGVLLINEIAPRPHNSGHYTIEACRVSQFEAHLKALLGLPINEEDLSFKSENLSAVMLNLLGGTLPDTHHQTAEAAKSIPEAYLHMYGKGVSRPGRKMGHVTILAESTDEVEKRVEPLLRLLDPSGETESVKSLELQKAPAAPLQHNFRGSEGQSLQKGSSENGQAPLVAVTMGSDSDRFILKAGIEFLKAMEVPYLVTITSAHRTPERMFKFAREAASSGIKVIIAAAGGAAHLPGMIAAITTLPVIGIPVKGSVLDGSDSLLSIVQMPRGCPVATVAINNSVNAAQLAVRILALDNAGIRKRLEAHLADQTASVTEQGERMERVGFEAYV